MIEYTRCEICALHYKYENVYYIVYKISRFFILIKGTDLHFHIISNERLYIDSATLVSG